MNANSRGKPPTADGDGNAAAGSFDSLLNEAARISKSGPTLRHDVRWHPGVRLANGRVTIVSSLGEGGMGIVYEAFDELRKQRVACKTLTRLDAASIYHLKNEFRALSDVAHPNIVRLHELFRDGSTWFFTMELIKGQRFDRWVRPSSSDDQAPRLDESRLRAALPQLLAAIRAIHGAGKLHRDLKPSNVLVTSQGRVVVLDFGLAADPELGGVGQTLANEDLSGTPAYMAPEQATGAAATAASDYYAMGIMLFEALTGALPFDGTAYEVLVDKQRRDAPRARELAPDAPADLEQLCSELLARSPAARPQASEVYARLGLHAEHSLEATRADTSSAPSPIEPSKPELLGREAELEVLRAAFAATCEGRPVVLFVSGDSGIGKSALCEAFTAELRQRRRATVLAGRCHERENVQFKGFDALVDDLSRYLRKLPATEAAAVLPRETYALARLFPVLARIAVVAAAPSRQVSDLQDLKRRAFDAVGELLARMRDRAPLVISLDDVQWFDRDSVDLIRALFLHPDPVPLLIVCAHRSEGAEANTLLTAVRQGARDNARIDVRELRIGALPPAALLKLVEGQLPGAARADAQIIAELAGEARGSPFFAMELARAAAVRGLSVPSPSLGEALNIHLAMLPASAREVLRLLAIAGQPIPAAVATQALRARDREAYVQLDLLRDERLVRISIDDAGARTVECYHDQIREQIVAGLDAQAKQRSALELARAFAAHPQTRDELMARLLELADLPAEAAMHAAAAADAARATLAFDRAARLYAQALAHGQFGPERTQELRQARADALAQAGYASNAAEAYLLAAKHAPEASARVLERQAAEQYLLCGKLERGRALLDRALRQVGHSLPASLLGAVASVVFWRTRLRVRGLSLLKDQRKAPVTQHELELLSIAVNTLIRSDALRGMDFAARYALRALDAGHEVEAARALSWEFMSLSISDAPLARVDAAIAQCAELCERTGDARARGWLLHCRAMHKLMRLGEPDLALKDFDDYLVLLAAQSFSTAGHDLAWLHCYRSFAIFWNGRVIEAGELANRQLEDALVRGDQTVAGVVVQTAVMGLLARGRTQQAERILDEAKSRLQDGEITIQHMIWLMARLMISAYAGTLPEVWRATKAARERYLNSWLGRSMGAGTVRTICAAAAAGAALATSDETERAELRREAKRLVGRHATSPPRGIEMIPPKLLLACLDDDQSGAIAVLRQTTPSPKGPMSVQLFRRRLGELIGGVEGAELVTTADTFLHEAGVSDPARFVCAFMPGIAFTDRLVAP